MRHSPDRLSSLLADDFREFGSSGRIWSKREIIDALSIAREVQWSISDFRVEILDHRIALVTYRAVKPEQDGQLASACSASGAW